MIPMATGTWLLVSWLSLLRGSRRGPSPLLQAVGCAHLTLPCTSGWWALLALVAVLPLGVTRVAASRLLARHRAQVASGYVHMPGEPVWTPRAVVLYPSACVLAGVAAGLLGIGGGMVLGPLLVELGCLPQPIAATSAYVVFITATAGLAQVTILGLLPGDYALLFSCFGVFATFLGQTAVDYVVKKYKKDAIVILVIGAIMIIALVLMAYNGIMQMIYAENYGFSPLC